MRMAKTLQDRLDKANCDYDIIPHPHSATSLESARTAGVPAERTVHVDEPAYADRLAAAVPLDLARAEGVACSRGHEDPDGTVELGGGEGGEVCGAHRHLATPPPGSRAP